MSLNRRRSGELPDLTKEQRNAINEAVRGAQRAVRACLDVFPREALQRLVDLSLALPEELVGEKARIFIPSVLGDEAQGYREKVTRIFEQFSLRPAEYGTDSKTTPDH
jgi:hypothetical protein